MQQRPRIKRRIKLIKPRLQLRMIGTFAGVCVLGLLGQTLIVGLILIEVAQDIPDGAVYFAQKLPALLGQTFLLSLVLLVPALLLIGTHATFRIAGPLFRFERHLTEVGAGERPAPCRLRRDDELQDFCALLNAAIQKAREEGVLEPESSEPARDRAA